MKLIDAAALANLTSSASSSASSSPAPLAVVFAREGAAPSQQLVAAADSVAAGSPGLASFVRIDLDAPSSAALVAELRVHKVPELLVWNGQKLVARVEGALNAAELREFLEHVSRRR